MFALIDPSQRRRLFVTLCLLVINAFFAGNAHSQYLGVTCGWQYSSQLTGPLNYPGQLNIPLYNPDPKNPDETWDEWAAQLGQAGVDYVCPNLTGSYPNSGGSPTQMAPLLTALNNRGLANRIKLAIFDDNASSWVAQWNDANGRGYGYAEKFDMSDTNNWKYIYDYNYKLFYETVPDTNRFKINGRPLITIWTGNTVTFLTNMQGNASRALTYVRQCCQRDFGFNPYIVLSQDFFSNDTTCNNAGIADGSESWFTAGPKGPAYTLTTKNGVKVGVAVAEFQHPGQSGFLNPNHGQLFQTGLSNTIGDGALLTLCEGFTDCEEDAAQYRAHNRDANGNPLTYSQTLYDYPNQRLNILRSHGNSPFPPEMKLEVEGCDDFSGAAGGNGKTNYYRNGNIAIEPTSDVGGGFDVGWIQPGESFVWQAVPMQGSRVHLQVRVASASGNGQLHFVIDGTNYPAITVPNTGGNQNWETIDSGVAYQFAKGSVHTVTLVCDTGGFNVNYWQYHDDLPIGVNVNLKSVGNGQWLSVAAGTVNANVATPGTNEVFTIVAAEKLYGYGYVALQSQATGLYLTADTNGVLPLAANATAVDVPQMFEWTDNGDGTILLRATANSMLVSVTNRPATFPVIADRLRSLAGTNESFAVYPVSTNQLSFVAAPNNTPSDSPITAGNLGEIQVLATDGNGHPVPGAPVTLAIASGSGSLTGNNAVTDANGIAHFTTSTIDKIGAKTLVAASSAFSSAISAPFSITAGAPSTLNIETLPDGTGVPVTAQTIAAGNPLSVYAIYRDAENNFVTNTPAVWSLVNPTGGVVAGDLVTSADSRSVAFTGHLVGTANIQAAAAFTVDSGLQTVAAGAAATLVIAQQPSATASSGSPLARQPIVSETDAFGNPAASPITATDSSGNLNANPAGVTVAPINGSGVFTGLFITNTGTSHLLFTAGSASIASADIVVSIGNAQRLTWTTSPGNAFGGSAFGITPVIQTVDAGGNVTTLGLPGVKYVQVTVSTGSGTLLGTTVTNIGTLGGNGTVALADLGVTQPGTYQLNVQDIGNGFNPTNISAADTCQLWLDAADTNTLDVAAFGATISQWNDKSGHGNNGLGSATFAFDPLLTATSPGQAQTVSFNGSQQFAVNLQSLTNTPYTILVMEVGASKSSGNSYFIGNSGGYNTDLTLGVGYQTSSQFRWQQYADDLNYNATFTNVQPRQWTMNLHSSPSVAKFLYLNSTQVGTAASGYLQGANLANGSVGDDSYVGNLAEIIVYNSSLSLTDQTNLQNYLNNKWLTGLSPALSAPFVVTAPTLQPVFNNIESSVSGGELSSITFTGTNGPANGIYRILTATNPVEPLAAWTPILTNHFDGSGTFSNTLPINPNEPARFYRLAQP